MLHVHISDAALHNQAGGHDNQHDQHGPDGPGGPAGCDGQGVLEGMAGVARLVRGDQPISIELVRQWCAREDTQITILPIRDLADHIHSTAYQVTGHLRTQVEEINQTCVFPWCERPATSCDKDHTIPHAQGGATCSCNIAPLCRRHHRLKTHTPWLYHRLDPSSYLWTSPDGEHNLRNDNGTTDLTPRPASTQTAGNQTDGADAASTEPADTEPAGAEAASGDTAGADPASTADGSADPACTVVGSTDPASISSDAEASTIGSDPAGTGCWYPRPAS